MPAMDCQRALYLLSDQIDGELTPQLASQLAEHLAECRRCSQELASLESLVRLARDPASVAVPNGFSTRLYRKVQQLWARQDAPPLTEVPAGITDEMIPVGSHLIHFWQGQADFERGVRFLYPGLGKDEHCIIFGHVEALERVQNVLREAGYDPEQLVRDRKLTVLKRHANADTTIAEISEAIQFALEHGARLVRYLGNLGMESAPLPAGESDVLDLETKADALVRGLPAVIVCMYDVSTLPGRLLFSGGLQHHDLTVCPGNIQKNPFYCSHESKSDSRLQ